MDTEERRAALATALPLLLITRRYGVRGEPSYEGRALIQDLASPLEIGAASFLCAQIRKVAPREPGEERGLLGRNELFEKCFLFVHDFFSLYVPVL
jgi:hypothetical protein